LMASSSRSGGSVTASSACLRSKAAEM
jgi:hypothetical protein